MKLIIKIANRKVKKSFLLTWNIWNVQRWGVSSGVATIFPQPLLYWEKSCDSLHFIKNLVNHLWKPFESRRGSFWWPSWEPRNPGGRLQSRTAYTKKVAFYESALPNCVFRTLFFAVFQVGPFFAEVQELCVLPNFPGKTWPTIT